MYRPCLRAGLCNLREKDCLRRPANKTKSRTKLNHYQNLIPLDSSEKLDALFEESHFRPVALLKHSNTCGISADILHQLEQIDGDIHVLTIQLDRPLSASVAERIGHRHQSPQIFVLKDEKAIYHATHYAIDPDKIARLLANL